jgi:hypothetical protein
MWQLKMAGFGILSGHKHGFSSMTVVSGQTDISEQHDFHDRQASCIQEAGGLEVHII